MTGPVRDRRFSPGEWYAVSGDAVTLLLPPAARSRVAALWELADSGASADELLDAVLADGIRTLGDLVVVSESADSVRVLVRGSASAVVHTPGSTVSVAAAPGTVWNEQLVAGATGVRVQVGDGALAAESPLGPGIARIGVLEVGTLAPAAGDATGDAASPADDSEQVEPVAGPQVEAPEVEGSVTHAAGTDTSDPEVLGRRTPPAGVPAPPAPPVPPAPPAPSASGLEPPASADESASAEDWSDRDGHTRVGAPADEFARPPMPGQEVAPPVLSKPVAKLVFSTGDVVDVDRVILAGRAPEARRFASHDQPRMLTLPSPHQEISSTHLEVRPGAGADHGMAIVTDLGSTNGTVLMQPGLPPEDLRPGIAVSLVPGAVLDLGDGVTIQVTNP